MAAPMHPARPVVIFALAACSASGGVVFSALAVINYGYTDILGMLPHGTGPEHIPVYFAATTGILAGIGAWHFAAAYWIFAGITRAWEWIQYLITVSLAFSMLDLIGAIFHMSAPFLGITGTAANITIMYYLRKPHVKRYFGR